MTAHAFPLADRAARNMGCRWLAPAMQMAAVASGNWPLAPDPGTRSWTCFPRVATSTPGLDARSVRAARDFTIATMQRWGAAQRGGDIAIVVSELLSNALRHALPCCAQTRPRWPIRLGLLQPGPCVVCAVADPCQQAPAPKDPGLLAETGRGLHVIGALADVWGYTTPTDTGKVVWALFSITPGQPHRSPGHSAEHIGARHNPADALARRALEFKPTSTLTGPRGFQDPESSSKLAARHRC